ncbi:MAG: hypothetical protein R2762_30500 [Bryobacteraceae bacterium]
MFIGRAMLALTSLCLPLAAGPGPGTVAVYLDYPTEMTPASRSAMERESQRILDSTGFRIVWKKLAERDGSESFENLAVFRFAGSCASFFPGDAAHPGGESLADTAVSEGRVLPFSVLRCERIARMLSSQIGPLPSGARDGAFGRALGRVAAHELFHILGQTKGHHADGISKACFSAMDLLKVDFGLGSNAVAQLRPERVEQPHTPGEVWSDEPSGR